MADQNNRAPNLTSDAKKTNSINANGISARRQNFGNEILNEPSEMCIEMNIGAASAMTRKTDSICGRNGSDESNGLNNESRKSQVREKIQPRNQKGRFASNKENDKSLTGETKIKTKKQAVTAVQSGSKSKIDKENSERWIQLTEDLIGLQPRLTGVASTSESSGRRAAIEARKRTQLMFERENDEARIYKKRNRNETTANPSVSSSESILTTTPLNSEKNNKENETTGDFASEGNEAEKGICI